MNFNNDKSDEMQICHLTIRTTLEEIEKHFANQDELYELQGYQYDKDDLERGEEYNFECSIKYKGNMIDTNKIYNSKTLEDTLNNLMRKDQVQEEFTI